ncbi:MAG: methionyl-tRNA formyltransferase [Thermoleophilia bacterium]
MRIAFAGTAPVAEIVLAGLVAANQRPVVVITNPDRPKGRHGTPTPPPIKLRAEGLGVPVLQPQRISDDGTLVELRERRVEVLVVCAYGQILRQNVLDAVTTIVVHPSLVPRWRGAAPVERALMAGETDLGVTILKMTAGVDEGPVGALRRVEVPPDADAGRAYELIAPAAVDALLETLAALADGSIVWRPQSGEVTYADKILPTDRVIDWSWPAHTIVNHVRALSPHIGAVMNLLGRRTVIWRAAVGEGPQPAPGATHLALPAGDGWIEVLELQQEGRTRVAATEFLRGAGRALAGPH